MEDLCVYNFLSGVPWYVWLYVWVCVGAAFGVKAGTEEEESIRERLKIPPDRDLPDDKGSACFVAFLFVTAFWPSYVLYKLVVKHWKK